VEDKRARKWHSQTDLIQAGFLAEWSEGAIRPPIFPNTTYLSKSAEELERAFRIAYGLCKPDPEMPPVLMYNRINHPNAEICEDRLSLATGSEACALFSSGMAAIDTLLFTLNSGDTILHSRPVYGGTNHLIKEELVRFGINNVSFGPDDDYNDINKIISKANSKNLAIVYVESPANPTNTLFDLELCGRIAKEHKALFVVDNTFLGPMWQNPTKFGADLVVYSATKFIGGHNDVLSGAITGSKKLISEIKARRGIKGNIASPFSSWLLTRSLEDLFLRTKKQMENAKKIAKFLNKHPNVTNVYYPSLFEGKQGQIYKKLGIKPGAMIPFEIKGTKREAYLFLNNLKLVKLAVSLGGTITLAEHPHSMTHIGVSDKDKIESGINESLIRLSVGLEHYKDIIKDLDQALYKIYAK